MSNYATLKATIDANIAQNGVEAITGDILNSVLNTMVTSLGAGYQFMGVATPSTNPGTPDQKVFYLASQPGTYTNFGGAEVGNEVAVLKYATSWTKETALGLDIQGEIDSLIKTLASDLPWRIAGTGMIIKYNDGTTATGTGTDYSNYVDVSNCTQIVYARGLTTSSTTLAGMAFYDSSMTYISGQRMVRDQEEYGYEETVIEVPANAKYARFSIWQNAVAEGFFIKGMARDTVQTLTEEMANLALKLMLELPLTYSISGVGGVSYANGSNITGTTTERTNYINVEGVSAIRYSRGTMASTTNQSGMAFYDSSRTFISGQRFVTGQSTGYEDTVIQVPSNAKYARFTKWMDSSAEGFYLYKEMALNEIVREMVSTGKFGGKKFSIIGDSISCFGTEDDNRLRGFNAPYWIVKSVDVGQTIESWVTWLDMYKSVDGTTPTNKTIGGVPITAAMIGTKQTFTPVADDVGKAIGVPRWAGNYTSTPWWRVLIDAVGGTLCNNASWSGSRMIPIPEGNSRHDAFVLSEAYSDYTLGRVCNRDDQGNVITPDVIIIYRGTNDFSAQDPEGGSSTGGTEDITTPDMKTFTAITDPTNFTQAYIWTILKLRERYPSAYIVCCTMNMIKRVNYGHFPTNNGTYTLPQYSDKIREIANLMGCGLIEFDKDGITFENCYPTYISDNATTPTHPNTEGHRVMGEKAIADLQYVLNP